MTVIVTSNSDRPVSSDSVGCVNRPPRYDRLLIDSFTNNCVKTNIPTLLCSELPQHWRTNKSLPNPFFVIDTDGIPDGTEVTLTASSIENPSGELRNSVARFSKDVALFEDLRFVGKSGRGECFDLIITIHSKPWLIATYKNAVKVTADGPRNRRGKRKATCHYSGSVDKKSLKTDFIPSTTHDYNETPEFDYETPPPSQSAATDETSSICRSPQSDLTPSSLLVGNIQSHGPCHTSVIRHTATVSHLDDQIIPTDLRYLQLALHRLNTLHGQRIVTAALSSYLALCLHIPTTSNGGSANALAKALYLLQIYGGEALSPLAVGMGQPNLSLDCIGLINTV